MPTVTHDALRRIGYQFFEALGCRPADARIIQDHLVQSNLYGHDSHGIVRMEQYWRAVREEGVVDPQAAPEIVREHPCTAVVDAHHGFGQVGAVFATKLLIEKAQRIRYRQRVAAQYEPHWQSGRVSPHGGAGRHDRADIRQRRSAGLSGRSLWRHRRPPGDESARICRAPPPRSAVFRGL